MKKSYLLSILFFTICCSSVDHYHDGEYIAEVPFIGEVKYIINGSEILVDNGITGIRKIECEQFPDRIEYMETNGVKQVLPVLENGDIKQSEWIILKRVKSKENDKENVESEDIKVESLNNKKQVSKTKEVHNEKNNYKESETEIINPKSIIRNPEKGQEIKKIVDAKDENYNFNYNDERRNIRIILKSDNTEYVYDPEYESVEAYTYYSFKSIAEIKDKLESFGVEFYDDYDNKYFHGGLEEYGSSCRQISLEKLSDRVKISYSFECD